MRSKGLPIQNYKDIGAGWFSEPTYEYGQKVYLIVYTRFEQNPNYYIDAAKEFMRETY
jgi:hypothetical protein